MACVVALPRFTLFNLLVRYKAGWTVFCAHARRGKIYTSCRASKITASPTAKFVFLTRAPIYVELCGGYWCHGSCVLRSSSAVLDLDLCNLGSSSRGRIKG